MRLELQRDYLHAMGVQVWQEKTNRELVPSEPKLEVQISAAAVETSPSKVMFSVRADIHTQQEEALLNNILQAIGQNRAAVNLEPLKAEVRPATMPAGGIIFGQQSIDEGLTDIPHTLAEIIAQPSLKRVVWQRLQALRSH